MRSRALRALFVAPAFVLALSGRPAVAPAEAAAPTVPSADAPAATMVGFRKTGEKSALVYVQLTAVTEVRSKENGKTLTFTLKGISVPKRNNRYPLLTSYFDSFVESARLVPVGRDTDLIIVLSRDAGASAQVLRTTEGAVLEVHLTESAKTESKAKAK